MEQHLYNTGTNKQKMPGKVSIHHESKIKTFSEKEKLRKFLTSKFVLQEVPEKKKDTRWI